jgi:hypothetical protein
VLDRIGYKPRGGGATTGGRADHQVAAHCSGGKPSAVFAALQPMSALLWTWVDFPSLSVEDCVLQPMSWRISLPTPAPGLVCAINHPTTGGEPPLRIGCGPLQADLLPAGWGVPLGQLLGQCPEQEREAGGGAGLLLAAGLRANDRGDAWPCAAATREQELAPLLPGSWRRIALGSRPLLLLAHRDQLAGRGVQTPGCRGFSCPPRARRGWPRRWSSWTSWSWSASCRALRRP